MRNWILAAAAVLAVSGSLSAGEAESMKALAAEFGPAAMPEARVEAEIIPARVIEAEKAALSPKICVSPVTSDWKNAMLIKFRKGVDLAVVKSVMKEAGLSGTSYADNGMGYYVRIDIRDAQAPAKALVLAKYAVVEAVQVNHAVYALLQGKSAAGVWQGAYRYGCRSLDDNEPYELGVISLDTIGADGNPSFFFPALNLKETYKIDNSYTPDPGGPMTGYLRLKVQDPDYDAYTDGPLTPFYIEEALLKGGYKLNNGKMGGFVKTDGAGYAWAKYICER